MLIFRMKNVLDVSRQLCYPTNRYNDVFPQAKHIPRSLLNRWWIRCLPVGSPRAFCFPILAIIQKLYYRYVEGNHLLSRFMVNRRKRRFFGKLGGVHLVAASAAGNLVVAIYHSINVQHLCYPQSQ